VGRQVRTSQHEAAAMAPGPSRPWLRAVDEARDRDGQREFSELQSSGQPPNWSNAHTAGRPEAMGRTTSTFSTGPGGLGSSTAAGRGCQVPSTSSHWSRARGVESPQTTACRASASVVAALAAGCATPLPPISQRRAIRPIWVLAAASSRGPVEPEHPVTDLKGRDAPADRLDVPGELVPEGGHPRSAKPGEEPPDKRLGRPQAAVGPIRRGCVDLDQDLVVLGDVATSAIWTTPGG
jgi:hypothetical protein